MKTSYHSFSRWIIVCLFAIAFAWVESAVVYYLRLMLDRMEPYQANPLPMFAGIAWVELLREFATMVMLLTVGCLAGRNLASRLGYALIAFGVWDIFYYIFLKPMTGWPNTLLDWDILFLIPLPWWGPILAPMLIAFLMISWGTLITQIERLQATAFSNLRVWSACLLGVFLALYVFMADAIPIAIKGEEALREMLPTQFNWTLFSLALCLMSAPTIQLVWIVCQSRGKAVANPQS